MKKPFLVFAGYDYYPAPGIRDYRGRYATKEEAQQAAEAEIEETLSWAQVVDVRELGDRGSGEPVMSIHKT